MICKNCGKEFSDENKICPECSAEYTEEVTAESKEDTEAVTESATDTPNEQQKGSDDIFEKPKMSGRKKAVIAIGAAIIFCALLSAVIFAVVPAVKNAVIDNKPPKEYLEYIITEKNSSSEALTGIVNTVKEVSSGMAGVFVTAEYQKKEAFDDFSDALEISIPSDEKNSEGLQSFGITLKASENDGLFALGMDTSVNGSDIIDTKLAASTDGSAFYFFSPELSDTAAVFNPGSYNASEINAAVLSFICKLPSVLPENDRTKALLDKYIGIAFDSLLNVTKTDSTVSVGNITQKCNLITVSLSSEDIINIAKNVLTEASNDSELTSALTPVIQLLSDCTLEYLEKTGASEFKKIAAREMLRPETLNKYIGILAENIDIAKLPGKLIFRDNTVIELRTNNKHELIGITLIENDKPVFSAISAVKGGKFHDRITVGVGAFDLTVLSGSGKISGGKKSGEYEIGPGAEYIRAELCDFDIRAWNKGGLIKGTIKLSIGRSVTSTLLEKFIDPKYTDIIRDSDITLSFDRSGLLDASFGAVLGYKDKDVASLNVKAGVSKADDFVIPENTIDVSTGEGLAKFKAEISTDRVVSSLEKADAPSGMIELVQGFGEHLGKQ